MHLLPGPGGFAAPPSSATSQDSMNPDDRSRPWGTSAAISVGHSPLPSFDPAVLPEVAQEVPAGGQAGAQPPGSLGPFNFGGAGPGMDSLGGACLCWAALRMSRLYHSSRAHVAHVRHLEVLEHLSTLSWQHGGLGTACAAAPPDRAAGRLACSDVACLVGHARQPFVRRQPEVDSTCSSRPLLQPFFRSAS